MSKYHAKRVESDGQWFDSRKELNRYRELALMERTGKIRNLRRQVRYQLIPSQRGPDITGPRGGTKRGSVLEKGVSYVADFVYERDGETIVEDTKGVRTEAYIIKRKLMLWVHGIRVLET